MSLERYHGTMQNADDLCTRIGCGIRMVAALYDAMYYGTSEPEYYYDAIYGAYDYLSMLHGELQETVDALYNERTPDAEGIA